MKYDSVAQKYYNKVNLKQGYYNYIFVNKNGEKIDARKIEGSHFDANNEYIIKVYYRDPLGFTIGYFIIKSTIKTLNLFCLFFLVLHPSFFEVIKEIIIA